VVVDHDLLGGAPEPYEVSRMSSLIASTQSSRSKTGRR
jgi:hypothetical protein